MKHVYKIIGIVVVIIILVAALLYYLNSKNILKGPISEWITNVENDILSIFGHTKDMVHEMGNSDNPVTDSINIP
jgi:hypothetical protein